MSVSMQNTMARVERGYAIASRIEAYRQKRIDALAEASGVGRNACAMHNALLARESGRPWREVNYTALRQMNRLLYDYRHNELARNLAGRLIAGPRRS